MSRYIDADLLKQCIQNNITRYFTCGTGGYCLAEDVVEDIDAFPTADVVEVRHGEWVSASKKQGTNIGMKCSLCNARIKYSEFFNGNHNYCHKCGAKMDGKRKEDEGK